MPGTTPAASQLDWLISSTTTMVLFCSKVIRERLRSSTWVMGAPPSIFAQRQRCQTFAAVPIASGPGTDIRQHFMLQQRGRFSAPIRYSLEPIGCGLLSLGAGMRRREFIAAIGGTVWPLAVRAQQSGPRSSVYFGPMQMPRLRADGEVLEVDSLRPSDCAPSSKAMFRLY